MKRIRARIPKTTSPRCSHSKVSASSRATNSRTMATVTRMRGGLSPAVDGQTQVFPPRQCPDRCNRQRDQPARREQHQPKHQWNQNRGRDNSFHSKGENTLPGRGARKRRPSSPVKYNGIDELRSAGSQPDPLHILFHVARTLAQPAVAPLPPLEIRNRLQQVNPSEIRPQPVGHKDLGIGDLPEQIVRDAASRPRSGSAGPGPACAPCRDGGECPPR